MYLIVIAWLYVTVMMAVAEASSPQGTVLGACITLVLYGLLPVGLLLYILGTPARKRRLQAERAAAQAAWEAAQASPPPAADTPPPSASTQPDGSGHAPGAAQAGSVAPVREKA